MKKTTMIIDPVRLIYVVQPEGDNGQLYQRYYGGQCKEHLPDNLK